VWYLNLCRHAPGRRLGVLSGVYALSGETFDPFLTIFGRQGVSVKSNALYSDSKKWRCYMVSLFAVANFLVAFSAFTALAQEFETDTIETSAGSLEITFIGHGTLMFNFGGKVIHIDPWSRLADYSKMPKADIYFIDPRAW
jgi:hypothetical protein